MIIYTHGTCYKSVFFLKAFSTLPSFMYSDLMSYVSLSCIFNVGKYYSIDAVTFDTKPVTEYRIDMQFLGVCFTSTNLIQAVKA